MLKILFPVLLVSSLSFAQTPAAQDADALEAQYTTCEKHHLPADKCTPEIYQQLKAKDNVPLDDETKLVVGIIKEYQSGMKNPESMQIRRVYITDRRIVCLTVGGQNGMGGFSVSEVGYVIEKKKWLDENHVKLPMSQEDVAWVNGCEKSPGPFTRSPKPLPGRDITDKVKPAFLK
jgi:hypothetical protein